MKKILSAVLAAAMVLSMGVMAFAASYGGTGTGAEKVAKDTVAWGSAYLERDGKFES